MGIKFLNLQVLPWCFQVMSNHISCVQFPPEPPARTIKLIKSDGIVKIYHRPVNVSELMVEFPKHMICDSDSFYIGQKISALSERDELQLGHKYFLLPKHLFQSVLSFVSIASFAASSKNVFPKNAANCRPFDIHKTPSGTLQIRVSDEFISKLMEEKEIKEEEESQEHLKGRVCTTPELQKDYKQLVGYRFRQWKPKLETITESERRRGGAFGIRRRKKTQSKPAQKAQQKLELSSGSSVPHYSKIKVM